MQATRDLEAKLETRIQERAAALNELHRVAAMTKGTKPASTAAIEKRIAMLEASLRDKQRDITAVLSQTHTTTLAEACVTAEELLQEHRRQAGAQE